MTPDQKQKVETAITGTFMWNFKKGDNIVYNFDIVWELYKAKSTVKGSYSAKSKFNKPILLLLVSIIECIMDDFVNRVGQHVNDRVPNITQAQINEFKTKKRDKLEHYIAAAKKHNIFNMKTTKLYDELDFLRKARNRFHIQNTSNYLDANESNIFTDANLKRAEDAFEIVLWCMMTRFYRGNKREIRYKDVPLPWKVI